MTAVLVVLTLAAASPDVPTPLDQTSDSGDSVPLDAPEAPSDDDAPVDPSDEAPVDDEPDADEDGSDEPIVERPVRDPTVPAVQSSTIPIPSIVIALVVLVAATVLARWLLPAERRAAEWPGERPEPGPAAAPAASRLAATPELQRVSAAPTASELVTLQFLIDLGEALIDAGDAVGHVTATLRRTAAVNGIHDLRLVVIANALIVSLAGERDVQTEVTTAGRTTLRLDQIEQVFRVASAAGEGSVAPADGIVALAEIRARPAPFDPVLRVVGHTLLTIGLAMILRGNLLDVIVAGGLGAVIGALYLASQRVDVTYQAFRPVVAAALVSVVVFGVGGVVPELSVFAPLVSPLVTLLPGALLTTSMFELSTGQVVSGAGRLASGALQLVLLALGVMAGAQLVGVPAAYVGAAPAYPGASLSPWVGVAVFTAGVAWFHGLKWPSLRWVLVVVYVAYAGQVVGGWFFGSTLSAFFGALAMTPIAVVVSRQATGPPMMVSFLPGFWLLVPGALGLGGMVQALDPASIDGMAALVTTGTTMIGISLGVLLGLAIGSELAARLTAEAAGHGVGRQDDTAGRSRDHGRDPGADG